jgi:hypothetical protein
MYCLNDKRIAMKPNPNPAIPAVRAVTGGVLTRGTRCVVPARPPDGGLSTSGGLMPDEKRIHPALPDLHAGNVAPALCHKLCIPGCILLTSNADGTIMMIAHGVNHARANEMLSRGMQINLNQHDEFVRHGMAGADAQAQQALLDGTLETVGGAQ